ncbi:MAG TPA: hypothetical protein VFI73_11165 [Candidatus Nitrosopolaris sp.]|nr:hypothetical protein [Candidatus Nitrosopolaris sp.]
MVLLSHATIAAAVRAKLSKKSRDDLEACICINDYGGFHEINNLFILRNQSYDMNPCSNKKDIEIVSK